jgi:methyl-accepting chemotaxis protein
MGGVEGADAVAGEAAQLSSSVHEIADQTARSARMATDAVAAGQGARKVIDALTERVGRIDAVSAIIADIAGRTNLLALNATIEAARAGDAGKGFAVVASEVKQLATQTAHSTEEISRQLAEVRAATGEAVAAVERIGAAIGEIHGIASGIAASVEQQGAATNEISRSIARAAEASRSAAGRVEDVSREIAQTAAEAGEVRVHAADLVNGIAELRQSVVSSVRRFMPEVNRRQTVRYRVDLPCDVTLVGRAAQAGRIVDLSTSGAGIEGIDAAAGVRGTVMAPAIGFGLPFRVVAAPSEGESAVAHVAFELDDAMAAKLANLPARLSRGQEAA